MPLGKRTVSFGGQKNRGLLPAPPLSHLPTGCTPGLKLRDVHFTRAQIHRNTCFCGVLREIWGLFGGNAKFDRDATLRLKKRRLGVLEAKSHNLVAAPGHGCLRVSARSELGPESFYARDNGTSQR